MKKNYLVLLIISLFLMHCSTPEKPEKDLKYIKELHSHAQPNKAVIKHLDLDIIVDFEKRIIHGKASYNIENNNAREIVLDSKFLEIEKVQADGKDTEFSFGEFDELLGQALKISIKKQTKQISIYYKTTENSEALLWLNPEQTTDKKHPFLFTLGFAILTRTWIPIQDSPQIKITYNAKVRIPKELMAVMSARNPKEKSESGEYTFNMPQPISPYLIALAVGDISYKAISNRTGIYAEKSMVNKVHYEFADMEKMFSAAEKLYGKYVWEQFDVLVLPPSLPYGGMENPRLIFATPTIIAGDRSLTSHIVHELAHAWSGNLVTNASWDDFWLNEGFTVYAEQRIMEDLYGVEVANMQAFIERQSLGKTIYSFKETPEKTKLKLDLNGQNPDDAVNDIAYNKAYLFIRTLEEEVGREKFDVFVKSYFQQHAFSTMTSEKFIAFLNENLLEKHQMAFNTKEWIYEPGIPENESIIASEKFYKVEIVYNKFIESGSVDLEVTINWTPQEWVHFLRKIPADIKYESFAYLDHTFDFTNSSNPFITMVWYEKAILHNYHENDIDNKIEEFLMRVGRRSYVLPIYKAYKNTGNVELAKRIYTNSRSNYHSITTNTLDEMLEF